MPLNKPNPLNRPKPKNEGVPWQDVAKMREEEVTARNLGEIAYSMGRQIGKTDLVKNKIRHLHRQLGSTKDYPGQTPLPISALLANAQTKQIADAVDEAAFQDFKKKVGGAPSAHKIAMEMAVHDLTWVPPVMLDSNPPIPKGEERNCCWVISEKKNFNVPIIFLKKKWRILSLDDSAWMRMEKEGLIPPGGHQEIRHNEQTVGEWLERGDPENELYETLQGMVSDKMTGKKKT